MTVWHENQVACVALKFLQYSLQVATFWTATAAVTANFRLQQSSFRFDFKFNKTKYQWLLVWFWHMVCGISIDRQKERERRLRGWLTDPETWSTDNRWTDSQTDIELKLNYAWPHISTESLLYDAIIFQQVSNASAREAGRGPEYDFSCHWCLVWSVYTIISIFVSTLAPAPANYTLCTAAPAAALQTQTVRTCSNQIKLIC